MFELIALVVALVGSLAVGLWDLKTSNVPGKIVFPMLALGIILHAASSFFSGSYVPFVISLEIGIAFSLFGIMMYYLGAWGDGDSALFAAMGFLVPRAFDFAAATFLPFAFSYFINVFIIGAFYTIAYSTVLVFRNAKLKNSVVKDIRKDAKFYPFLLAIPLAVYYFFPIKAAAFLAVLIAIMLPLYRVSRVIEKGLSRRISTRDLREDDIVGQNISFLNISKRYIRGLTKAEVRVIRRKMKFVLVKDGIRYTLVFFLALAFTLAFGDFFSFLV